MREKNNQQILRIYRYRYIMFFSVFFFFSGRTDTVFESNDHL